MIPYVIAKAMHHTILAVYSDGMMVVVVVVGGEKQTTKQKRARSRRATQFYISAVENKKLYMASVWKHADDAGGCRSTM